MNTHDDDPPSGGARDPLDRTGPFTTPRELAAALGTLAPFVRALAPRGQPAVEPALRKLVEAAETDAVPVELVRAAAELVAGADPELRRRLKYITGRVALRLVPSNVFEGLRAALDVP
jgi:hypothetical protein